MKNKDKTREIIKIGIHKHLLGVTLKEITLMHEKYFKKNNLKNRDKAFIKNLTMVCIRNRGCIEHILKKYLKKPLPKKLLEIKAILIMGLAQILFTRVENYAAVNTTVDFFYGRLKKWRALSNAVLRNVIREEGFDKKKYDPSIQLPKWLYNKWKTQYGETGTLNIIDEIIQEPYLDLKIKNNFDYWKKEIGGEVLINNTLRLKKSGDIRELKGYREGAWWVQNLAAQIPIMLFKNVKDEIVLDICSSPGGKTAQLLNSGAKVTALDISKIKTELLSNNIKRLNLEKNLKIITKDFLKWNTECKYNKIILDAPCSATGTVRKNPDVIWNKKESDIKRLSKLQILFLEKAITLLNKKGILIYCNCSMEYEEGERIIELLTKNKGIKTLPIKHEEVKFFPKKIINKGLIRTMPYIYNEISGLEGFFIARLIKI
ncbi:MAG: hypothetical protein CMP40_00550 [Rickettsiales bacterium]|nr:hypothetical protein [Rickettsiales bacterium]|tara:strand:- start:14 stop:1306 length:1293 start_codon:yes stop_codon:yes gene_type:complete